MSKYRNFDFHGSHAGDYTASNAHGKHDTKPPSNSGEERHHKKDPMEHSILVWNHTIAVTNNELREYDRPKMGI